MRLKLFFAAAALAALLPLGLFAHDGTTSPVASAPVPPVQAGKDSGETALVEKQLTGLASVVAKAREYSSTVLGNPDFTADHFAELFQELDSYAEPWPDLAAEAGLMVAQAAEDAATLLQTRENLFSQYTEESRSGAINPGTRLAWSLLRIASGGPETSLSPKDFSFDQNSAEIRFTHMGVPFHISLNDDDDSGNRFLATAGNYTFSAEWAILLQKPIGWMAKLASEMERAGISPDLAPEWEIMEGPGQPIAFTRDADSGIRNRAFFHGKLLDVEIPARPEGTSALVDEFLAAAKALHQGIMEDESIPRQLRQALHPVLQGTYLPVDMRDYFDNAFCRRLIEADYLERSIPNLSDERKNELALFRSTLAKVEAGYDALSMRIDEGERLVAVVGAEAAFPSGEEGARKSNDQSEAFDSSPQYEWRLENGETTVFYSPLPERQLFSFMLADRYAGLHTVRPHGVPMSTEVVHPILGTLARYHNGADKAEGSAEAWLKAANLDARGGRNSQANNLVWGFPLHVLYRDDQGDPVLLATADGVVPSPNFTSIADDDERLRAENAWLDGAAKVLGEPGELGLIFYHFFRYCSDSPLPEMPNLIGSHYGLSDTHQTVYQSLERRWVGRLIGDCDDLAEFFQVLTRRQGKLSHVMSLPAHAAAGYAEQLPDGTYQFVVLQTGPVMQFTAPTMDEVVEKAYRSFDRDGGETHLTAAAVPLLLRFADEETRTPFVLSARIYGDADYADAMIRVQEYWHKYTFSAAIAEMERLVKEDRELGSIKELGSLYERVGMYDRSAELRQEELAASQGDIQATLSVLLDLANMYYQSGDHEAALDALHRIEDKMNSLVVTEDADAFNRLLSFRSYWAILMSRQDEPERAWNLVRLDVQASKRQLGRVSESVLRTLIGLYDRMTQKRDAGKYADNPEHAAIMEQVGSEIESAMRSGFFRRDDAYNAVISRYSLLGRYAVAKEGRERGLELLRQDGPYASEAKDQTRRGNGISESDWEWLRIAPRLYLSYGTEMLDKEENPHLYNPEAAGEMLALVDRAVEKGTGLGSDISGAGDIITASLIRSFLNQDLDAFNQTMALVRDRNYSSLYDDAALVFGSYCGLVPEEQFGEWIDAFHRFFPGRQHYFKVVYRALDKKFYDHAGMIADATARFFADDELFVDEARFVEQLISRKTAMNN